MANLITTEQLAACLDWRYSTKVFDSEKKMSAEVVSALESALVKSASSFGLQPWKFLVVTNPEKRAALRQVSWNQAQVEEASHLLVLAVRVDTTEADIDRWLACLSAKQGKSLADLEMLRGMMVGFAASKSPEERLEWNKRQVYIALGQLLTAAAVLGVDACPMEGLDPAAYDRILGLEGSGYATVLACPVGYRSDSDKYGHLPKARFELEDVVLRVE